MLTRLDRVRRRGDQRMGRRRACSWRSAKQQAVQYERESQDVRRIFTATHERFAVGVDPTRTAAAYPVIWTLTSSLKASGDLYSAPWSLPDPAHFENVARAWVQGQLGQAFLNSAYVTAVSVSLILLFAVPAAFGFARLRLPLHAVLGLAILVPLMIPSEVILVPLFVMFRALGLLNTLEGLITLEVAGGVAFATLVLTTFFRAVPRELEDAARIDGARSVQVLWHIILPLAGPGIAAVAAFQSVFVWNDYFAPLIVIQKAELVYGPDGYR